MKQKLCVGLRLLFASIVPCAATITALSFVANTRAEVVAHSIDDWAPGAQGVNGWHYGRYDKTAEGASGNGYTAMPGGIDDFRPFETSGDLPRFGFIDDAWQYIAADGTVVTPPFTRMGQTAVHPASSDQPGGERWNVRRYVVQPADVAAGGNLALLWRMRKTDPIGLGVTGIVFHNGVAVDSQAIGGYDLVGIARSIYVQNVQAGDLIDLAYTPVGPGGDASDRFDNGAQRLTIRNDAEPFTPYSAPAVAQLPGFDAVVYADSVAQFSGVQGQDNWYYGYFNKTADDQGLADGYQAADFIEFPTTGDFPRFGFREGNWGYLGANGANSTPPFTRVGASIGHPNGANNAAAAGGIGEHWYGRRWVADREGPVRIEGFYRDNNTNCGDGTVARIFVDSTEIWTQPITLGTDSNYSVVADLDVGSNVDFLVDGGPSRNDGCDGTYFTARVVSPPPAIGSAASSVADFSQVQGHRNWRYGFWDRTRDENIDAGGDGVYHPAEFVEFGSTAQHGLDGDRWGWFAGPATEISAMGARPNGVDQTGDAPEDDDVHWAIRRWTSHFEGVAHLEGQLDAGEAGDGVIARIFVDGDEVYSALVTDPTATYSLYVPLRIGSILDFVIDPGFLDSGLSDGAVFTAEISRVVPEPSTWAVAALAAALISGRFWIVRRRR